MPKTVAIDTVPTIVRGAGKTRAVYADAVDYCVNFMKDEKKRTKEGIFFGSEDHVYTGPEPEANVGAFCTAIRQSCKEIAVKLACVIKATAKGVYVKYNGVYKVMSDEMKAQKAKARAESKAAKDAAKEAASTETAETAPATTAVKKAAPARATGRRR